MFERMVFNAESGKPLCPEKAMKKRCEKQITKKPYELCQNMVKKNIMKSVALTVLLYLFTNLPNYAVTYTFTGNLSDSLGTIQAGTTFVGSFSYSFPQVYDANGFYYAMIGNFTVNIGTEIVSIEPIPFTNENEPHRGIIVMQNKLDTLPPDAPIGSDLGWDEFRISFGRFGDGGRIS